MRPDRHFVLAREEEVRLLGRIIDEMMPAEVPFDSTNSITWADMGFDFQTIRQRVRETLGIRAAARLYQYGMRQHYKKTRPPGICMMGYPDSAKLYIPVWTVPDRDVTKNNLVQLAWIFDQAGHDRGHGKSSGPMRGPIYASGLVRRVMERAYDPMSLRMMLERSKRTKEVYELALGNYPRWVDAKVSMNLNYASASIKTMQDGKKFSELTYAGNIVTAVVSMPESVALGLKGRAIEEVIDWDLLRGSGLVITSANYLPENGGTLRLGVSDPKDITIFEEDPEEKGAGMEDADA